jgi:hypothetical protein
MNVMYSIYDRSGERFDYCEDEDNEYHMEYDKATDRLTVQHWNRERQVRNAPWPIIATYYAPRRCVRDWTL